MKVADIGPKGLGDNTIVDGATSELNFTSIMCVIDFGLG